MKSPNFSKWIFLIILIGIVGIYTYFKIKLQIELGPVSDTFDLLSNAALFAGKGFGYTDLNRPPLLSLLTSIFFIFDDLSIWPIFVVDGLLYVFGVVGLYLFLKERFDSLMSFIGSLLFATFPLIVTFTAVGYNDVSGVAVAIWAVYLTYLAVNKDSRYFLLSFPMAMLAFLTRFNNALIIFPIFLYILINRDKIKSSKNVFVGMLLSFLILVPLFLFFSAKFGNPLYPFLSFFQSSSGSGYIASTEHFAYNPDLLYFIKNMPVYIGAQSAVIIVFTAVGLAVHFFIMWRKTRLGEKTWSFNLGISKTNYKVPFLILLIFLVLISFGKIHYMFTEIIFVLIAYIAFLIVQDCKIDFKLDLLFFAWFMAFFIFQSVYIAKDHRYVITMYAPLAYFLVRGLSWAISELQIDFKGKNVTRYFMFVVLTLMMLSSVFTQFPAIEEGNQQNKLFNQEAIQTSNWIKLNVPDYRSKIIYADFPSYFAWYLQMDVKQMPFYVNKEKLYAGGTRDLNLTPEDYMLFKTELERDSPDYYISLVWARMNFTSSYEETQKIGSVIIFKKID
jgi:4-amino-4-deoxy-L-arabinose transferase-like glycosyltransferase